MSRLPQIIEQIEAIVKPMFENTEIQLVELNVKFRQRVVWIQLLIDKPFGGITMDECTRFNKMLVRGIEDQKVLTEDYEIEVSSPGLDRPLKTKSDFARATNKAIRVLLKEAFLDKWEYSGVMKKLQEDNLIIECDNSELSIPLEKIMKATHIV